jgi:hypothetical protein
MNPAIRNPKTWETFVVNEIGLIKPILRPLSSMTEEEMKGLLKILFDYVRLDC